MDKPTGWLLPNSVIEHLDDGLSRAGFAAYDAAVVLVRVPDLESRSGFAIKGAHTGESQVIAVLLADCLRRMLSAPVTLEPYDDEADQPKIVTS